MRVPVTTRTEEDTITTTERLTSSRAFGGEVASSNGKTFIANIYRLPCAIINYDPISISDITLKFGRIDYIEATNISPFSNFTEDMKKLTTNGQEDSPRDEVNDWVRSSVAPNLKAMSYGSDGLIVNGTFKKSLYEATGISLIGGFYIEWNYVDVTYRYKGSKTTIEFKVKHNGTPYTKIKLNRQVITPKA